MQSMIQKKKLDKTIEKIKTTCSEKFTDENGNPVDSAAKDAEIKERKRQTRLEKYGEYVSPRQRKEVDERNSEQWKCLGCDRIIQGKGPAKHHAVTTCKGAEIVKVETNHK